MTPLTNDQLREQFQRIYGRMTASLFELDQFRKNRPTRFYEPRTFKKKRKFRKSRIALPVSELSAKIADDIPNAEELMLDLTDYQNEATPENPANMQPSEQEHQKENEAQPESD